MLKHAGLVLLAVSSLTQAQEISDLKATTAEAPVASAETNHERRLDLGASAGINNPAGLAGVEADFRIIDWVSVGLGVGYGAWGVRVTPQVRAYPFGNSRLGLFVEVGSSLSIGGGVVSSSLEPQSAEMLFTPTVNAAVGWRISIKNRGWIQPRVGWAFRLRQDNVSTNDGQPLRDGLVSGVISLSQPGGFIIGLSGGFSLL